MATAMKAAGAARHCRMISRARGPASGHATAARANAGARTRESRGGASSVVARAFWSGLNTEALPNLEEIKLQTIEKQEVPMTQYLGKVLLVVNVASNCGYTASNYKDLVQLYADYSDRGLEIMAFPCNQFGSQEPGDNTTIQSFTKKYGVEFPLFDKVDVNGSGAHPFFKYLKEKGPSQLLGKDTKWNFEKFLLDREGNVVSRYGSGARASELAKDIEKLL